MSYPGEGRDFHEEAARYLATLDEEELAEEARIHGCHPEDLTYELARQWAAEAGAP